MAFGVCSPGYAQQQALQVLQNHVPSAVSSGLAAPIGPLPPDQNINFSIVLPLRKQTELTDFLRRLYDRSSPDYHHFLTVEQFTNQFGPTADDYQAVVSFVQARGFTVTGTPANRLVVPIAGSAAQINAAFNVAMRVYQHPTENRTFYSPDREPSLNLGVRVAHISGLNNFSLPHPAIKLALQGEAVANVTGSGPGGSYLGSDMRAAYYGDTILTGTGQAVGILEFGGYNLSDVTATFSNAGQSFNVPINNVLLDGATGAPYEQDAEQVLDIVQAIGMAPGLSQVRVYIGSSTVLDDANILNAMASENIAKQLSCSWGWRPDDPAIDDVFFEEFAAQGQSFFVASGDDGAFDAAISPFFYPAEDAYVTTIGGTHLTTNGAGGAWVSETAWKSGVYGSGGGISPDAISIPSWQLGVANTSNAGSTTLRNVPDLAMEGDFDNYYCNLGSCNGGAAGTSFAAPRWAGFMALVNQQAVEAGTAPSGGIGFINPAIYSIAAGPNFNSDLHDVTAGNNDTDSQPVWFSAVPGYDLVTGWGSANGQNLIDALAGRQVPGFWLESSLGNLSVNRGSSSSTTITVTDAGGFTGSVILAVTSALPSGVTASWGTNPTTGSSVLTLTASSSAPSSTGTLTITGTSGNLTVTTNLAVSVHAPSFALAATPSTVSISQGAAVTTTITVTPQYGFTGTASLAVTSALPSGVTASWSTNPTTGSSVLTLTASTTATPGQYSLTVTGTSGSLTATTILAVGVYAPSFTLSAGSVSIGLGTAATSYVYVNPQYGFNSSVILAVSGLPSGVTGVFAPNPTTGTSTLTLTASSTATTGTATVTITGTSGSLAAMTTLTLGIYAPGFTLSASSMSIGQGTSSTSYVEVNPQYGFTGNVNLSASGLPSGVTASLSPNPSTGFSSLILTASSTAPTGQYNVTIKGTSGSLTVTTTLTLGIYAPTFTLSANSMNVGQGTSSTSYVYLYSQYGFNGSVSLVVTGLPSGVTASISPNPTTGSSQMTLTTSSTATVGTATVVITGTSGSTTATTSFALGVYAPSFTLSAGSISLGQGTSGTSSVNVAPQYGFTGSANLSVSGLPSGVTASFATNPTNGSSVLTLTASSVAALGTSTLTIRGSSGSLVATTTATLGVYAPSFALSANSVNIGQGASNTSYVYVYPQYGFTGSVSLATSGLPIGVTASFAPNPTTGTSLLTLSANSSVALGQYPVTITGTSGNVTASTSMTLGVYAPSFTLSASSANIGQGTSGTSYVYMSPQYGFSGNVTLAASGLPSGVTASFSPNPATGSTVLTLAASSTVSPGQYTVTLKGTCGSLTATTTLTLGIYAPSFTLSGNSISIGQGSSTSSYVYINAQYGFSGAVNLLASGLPSGVTASFSPNPTSTGSSLLTLTAASTVSVGQYNFTVTGTSGSLTATTTLSLGVYVPSFTLSAYSAGTIGQGTSGTSTVSVNPLNGFSGSVTLAASGLPSGVTASFSPNPTAGTSVVTLTASSTASLGQYNVTITGTSGTLTASTIFSLTIAVPSFTIQDYSSVSVGQGSSGTSYVYVTPQNGFSGAVNLAISGLPSGVTASFSPNPLLTSTGGGLSVVTLTANSTATLGQYNVTVIGTSGNLAVSAALSVTIYAPAFTLSAYPGVSISPGNSGTSSVGVNSQYGFSGIVGLAVSGLPSGVTASFSPTSISTGTSQLTLTASSTASLGSYTVIISGTSGNVTTTTAITLGIYAPGFTLSTGSSLSIDQGASGTSIVIVNPLYGFNGGVILAASGLPSGVTASFAQNPTSTGSSVLTLTAGNSASSGQYNVTITGTAGTLIATTTLSLTVFPQSFSLSSMPSKVELNQGRSVTSIISVNPVYGFSGSVTLAALGLPSGVSASWSSNSTTGSDFLTLTASGTATLGPAVITVTGTSGALTATTALAILVNAAPAGTSTTLAVTSAGVPVTTVSAGSVVTLTAAVSAGSTRLTTGQVSFCDATSTYCGDIHLLGTAQLTSSGTAVLRFVPGMGSHTFKAVFSGSQGNGVSVSSNVSLTVSAANTSTTTLTQSGGNYALIATVTAQGLVSPTGAVSFVDTSNANSLVGTGYLSPKATALTWLSSQSPATGNLPSHVATADFNNDGTPDLAITNDGNNTLTILLGKGDGTFTAGAVSPTTSTPFSIAAGDFNGDGNADLVVGSLGNNSLTILLGNGDGTFTQSPGSLNASQPYSITVMDLNGDGIQDLAVANEYNGTVTILLGNGDGTFAGGMTLATGGWPMSIVVADFNGDGSLDLAVADYYDNDVKILLGNGQGIFSLSPVNAQTGVAPISIVAGDFNGDGKTDLALANQSSNKVTILLGNGDGTFNTAASPSTGSGPVSIVIGDFNADGKADLLTANSFDNSATALLGNGDGTFTTAATVPTGSSPWGVAVGPFNRNGSLGVAVANFESNTLTILTAQLTQTSTAPMNGVSPVGHGAHLIDASYSGDSNYIASVSPAISLTAKPATATVVVTPSSSSVTAAQAFNVVVVVNGANGNPVPTGSVTLTGGGYSSAVTVLSNGRATIAIPAETLATGTDTLTVSYTPDQTSVYNSAMGSSSVTVTSLLAVASITVTGTRGADSNIITVAFSGFTETVRYDTTSTANSIASAFAAMLSRDYLKSGLCASATGNLINLKLKAGAFQPISITNSSTSFRLTPLGFP